MTQQGEAASKRTVLVVDADDGVRAMLRMFVAVLGFEVVAAADGGEALALLESRGHDVVICDLLMPIMNGDELFRLCRERWPEVARRFIFFSGGCEGLPAFDFAAASGQPLLRKPCQLGELWTAIDLLSGGSEGLPAFDFAVASGQPSPQKPCRLAEMRKAIDRLPLNRAD